eukprot:3085765-Prymnesium_polylepis.1
MRGSNVGHRCCSPTSRRRNIGLPGMGCRWPHPAVVGARPLSTVRMQSALPRADGNLAHRADRVVRCGESGLCDSTRLQTRNTRTSGALGGAARPVERYVRPSLAREAIEQAGAADIGVESPRSCIKWGNRTFSGPMSRQNGS